MNSIHRVNADSTARTLLIGLAVFGLLLAAPAVHAEPATVSASGPTSVEPGETVTISFTLTNTGTETSGYVYDLSLPADWELIERSNAGGIWKPADSRWLWTTVGSGNSVTPSVTVAVPESISGGEYTITGTAKSTDGTEDSVTHTVSVAQSDEGGETTGSTQSDVGSTGSTQSDVDSSAETAQNDTDPRTHSTAEIAEKPTSVRIETVIEDADPEAEGVTVVPEQTTVVDRITFTDETVSGSIETEVYSRPPTGVTDEIAASIAAESGGKTTDGEVDDQTASEFRLVSVTDISPSSPEVTRTPATVRLRIAANRFEDPGNATIVHETADGWERLETKVLEADSAVILEADTDSFSMFAVVETQALQPPDSDSAETVESDQQTDRTETDDSSQPTLPGTLPTVGALIVVVLGALLLVRR